jgi:hypothetical protein
MLPIKIHTKQRIFRYYTGLSFFIFIWISQQEPFKERLIRHELIHFRQQVELLFVFHWLLYISFYILARIKGLSHYVAYRYNPFELEAYTHDNDLQYLNKRSFLAWRHYWQAFHSSWSQDFSHIPKNKLADWS